MKTLAILSVTFDYGDFYPVAFHNAKKYFPEEDLYCAKYEGLMDRNTTSYYDRLYFHKIVKLSEYIKENLLGKYECVLFLDASDTNFYRDPADIVTIFRSFNANIVFNGERHLWPNTNYTHLYPQKPVITPYCYLNSGAYIGYTEKIVYHMGNMIRQDYFKDDQGAWTAEYLLNTDIVLDQECKIFLSTLDSKEYITLDENNKPTIHTINPIVVHDNGPHTEDTIKISRLLL